MSSNRAKTTRSILVAPAGAYVDLGITLTEGTIYCVSAAGKIAPIADLGSGDFVSIIGVGTDTAGILDLMPLGATGYSIP